MTLISLDGKEQSAIGTKEYWNAFTSFQGSPLHKEIVKRVAEMLPADRKVFSGQLGARILADIEKHNPELMELYNPNQVGSLFGMTLWNYLSTLEDTWHFYKKSTNDDTETNGMIYFRSAQ